MPERPRTVVVDTTPIIALSSIGQLDLLTALYGESSFSLMNAKPEVTPSIWDFL
jgi:predicted nucleic acid-binding protein